MDNVTVETLAAEFSRRLIEHLGPVLRPGVVVGLQVEVAEGPGLGGRCYQEL